MRRGSSDSQEERGESQKARSGTEDYIVQRASARSCRNKRQNVFLSRPPPPYGGEHCDLFVCCAFVRLIWKGKNCFITRVRYKPHMPGKRLRDLRDCMASVFGSGHKDAKGVSRYPEEKSRGSGKRPVNGGVAES